MSMVKEVTSILESLVTTQKGLIAVTKWFPLLHGWNVPVLACDNSSFRLTGRSTSFLCECFFCWMVYRPKTIEGVSKPNLKLYNLHTIFRGTTTNNKLHSTSQNLLGRPS